MVADLGAQTGFLVRSKIFPNGPEGLGFSEKAEAFVATKMTLFGDEDRYKRVSDAWHRRAGQQVAISIRSAHGDRELKSGLKPRVLSSTPVASCRRF